MFQILDPWRLLTKADDVSKQIANAPGMLPPMPG
jgi:hypothetical protein